MSSIWKKLNYICECGKNYGSCGQVGTFYIWNHCSVSVFHIYQKNCEGNLFKLGSFTDNELFSLGNLITTPDDKLESLTQEEFKLLDKIKLEI
jgi:hypothetical protein